ncbi:T9SS type A sorting domain-containing protein [Flavobacterium helocola]|uniref:T9SS type A sorting domain-containing protein n=1 Tax=Flavobacterium helocola TaxID=3139139 RepID=A0ABU9I983_9FLAO
MKKTLLTLSLFASFFSFSQVLQSDNFNSFVIGNVGTAFSGASTGQGGYYTEAANGAAPTTSNNAANSNFQVVSTGNSSTNGLSIVGPNGDKGSRFMWKNGLPTAWTGRTPGNNIIEVEVDVNPGTRGTSRNSFGVRIYNADFTRTLAGFQVNASTGELFLVAYSTPSPDPVGNYSYPLAAAPGVQLPQNTWSRVGISYNFTTGEVLINSTAITGGPLGVNGSSPSTNPAEVDFVVTSGSVVGPPAINNTAAATMRFDNLVTRASNTDTLLSSNQFTIGDNSFVVYPNPTRDLLSISNPNNFDIKNTTVTDINGRVVKNQAGSLTQINVSDLNAGVYFVTIEAAEGKTTKKFIKQ